MIVFVIALIVTCISTKDKDEGEFGLEIRLQVRPRQLLHYDIASIYTHQKHPLSLKSKKWLKLTPDDLKRRKKKQSVTDGQTDQPTD